MTQDLTALWDEEPKTDIVRTTFKLGGQEFYAVNPFALEPASDFAQGVKTGSVDYDQRLHAFFITVDDYSGGIGYDRISNREDIGIFNDSPNGGADVIRSKHMTAPPYIQRIYSCLMSALTQAWDQNRNPMTTQHPMIFGTTRMMIGFPGGVFYSTDGNIFTFVTAGATWTTVSKLINAFDGEAGRQYLVFQENAAGAAQEVRAVYTSDNGANWTEIGDEDYWDVTYHNGFFYGLGNTGYVRSATYPTGAPSATILPPGPGQWLGPLRNPEGNTGLYFIKAGRLFYINIIQFNRFDTGLGITVTEYVENVVESSIGAGFHIAGGAFFNTQLFLTNGFVMLAYQVSGSQELVREVGFQVFRSVPETIRDGTIRAITTDEKYLYIGVQVGADTILMRYNGRGWMVLHTMTDFQIQSMGVARIPTASWPVTSRGLYIVGVQGTVTTTTVLPTGNGADTAWTGDYQDVDDVGDPDVGTYIVPTGSTVSEGFTHGGITLGSGTVARVRIHVIARGSSPAQPLRGFLRIGTTYYFTPDFTVINNSQYQEVIHTWSLSPATGVAFTEAEIDALQFGVRWATTNNRVTQVYLEVDIAAVPQAMEIHKMYLPTLSSIPEPDVHGGSDRFSNTWSVETAWMDGGFIDLRGVLYQLLAEGHFTSTEYVEIYYSVDDEDNDDSVEEVLLGTLVDDITTLYWGTIAEEGFEFRSFRLLFKGYGGVADTSYDTVTNGDTDQALGDAAARTRIAQPIEVVADTSITDVLIYIEKNGSPTDDLILTLEEDSSGAPSGNPIDTARLFTGSTLFSTYGWRNFQFQNFPELTAGTTYYLVLKRSGANDAANYYKLRTDTSSPDYDHGGLQLYNASWGAGSGVMLFRAVTDKTKSADLHGFVVNYDKRPDYRAQAQLQVDVDGMIADEVLVDGVPATFQNIYDTLIEIWDSKALVPYEIPGVRSGYCKLASLPVVVNDNVEERVVKGTITIQILEPTEGKP